MIIRGRFAKPKTEKNGDAKKTKLENSPKINKLIVFYYVFFPSRENMSSTIRSASQSYSIPAITSSMVLPGPVGEVPNPNLDPNQQLVIIYFC